MKISTPNVIFNPNSYAVRSIMDLKGEKNVFLKCFIKKFYKTRRCRKYDQPICFPYVNGLWVVNPVFFCHVVQEVKEESDSDGWRPFCTQYGYKDIIYKLLQSALKIHICKHRAAFNHTDSQQQKTDLKQQDLFDVACAVLKITSDVPS